MLGEFAARMSRRMEYALLGSVIVFSAAVRMWSLVGIVRLDSFRYMELSNHVLSGGSLFDANVFFASSRLTLVGPLLLSNRLFGFGTITSIAWPLACSLLAVVGVWIIGRELFGPPVGLLAAFVLACMPLEIELATQLLPDPIVAGFIVVSIALAVLALKRDKAWRAYAIGSGAALGLAYFARINALVFLPGVLVAGLLLEPKKWKRSLWSLAGLGAVLVAAAGIFWILSGDPLVDWHRAAAVVAPQLDTGFETVGERFWRQFITMRMFLPFVVMVAVGTIWALFDRKRPTWFALIWLYGFYLYVEFISPLHGMGTSYRYAEPLMPPAAILFACAVLWVVDRLPRRSGWIATAAVTVGIAVALAPIGHAVAHRRASNARWVGYRRAMAAIAQRGDQIPIVGDDAIMCLAVNFDSEYTLGRDTLSPLSASVNAHARLWTQAERPLVSGQPVYWVSQSDPPTKDPWQLLAKYKFVGRVLRLYIVNPQP